MEKLVAMFERVAVSALVLLLMATIVFGTVVVAWSLIEDLLQTRALVAEPRVLFDIFGLFVAVLVGVELLKILRYLLLAHEVNTALVVQTALMALCNKVITLNLAATSWTTLVAVSGLILSLAAAVHALRRDRL
ncbi:MAG TPA: phosphate-starvation-inducible PsiE family protein [Steroidobacteraceae bacterium]